MTQHQGRMRETYPVAGESYRYRTAEREDGLSFELDGEAPEGLAVALTLNIESTVPGEGTCRDGSGRTHAFAWAWVGPELHLWLDGVLYLLQLAEPAAGSGRRRGGDNSAGASGDILSPMPGTVLEVLVAEGDRVERNQTLMVMESMKMELLISAPRDGVVRRVSVQPGQQVERGMRLLELAAGE